MEEHFYAALREYSLTMFDKLPDGCHAPALPVDAQGLVRQLLGALDGGEAVVDVTVVAPLDAASAVQTIRHTLADADTMAAAGLLLIPPSLPEIKLVENGF